MSTEENTLAFWRNLRELRERLQKDSKLRKEFESDPVKVLRQEKLDIALPEPPGDPAERTLVATLQNMSGVERRAIVDSLMAVSNIRDFGAGKVAVVTPNANANTDVNANVAVNANAHANANTNSNTNGAGINDVLLNPAARVTLPSTFAQSALARKLTDLKLNRARQTALFKRALTDPDSLVRSKQSKEGEVRVARYVYRGAVFEVEALVTGETIAINKVKLVK
jgi:hypothetical protein